MNDFEIVRNQSLVTTMPKCYPSLGNAVVLTAAGAWANGSIAQILPAATNEVNTFAITHACDVAGIITINLDGVNYPVTLATGTTAEVAAQLRALTFGDWTVTGATTNVVFTRKGVAKTGTFTDTGSTAVTITVTKTTTGTGIGKQFDVFSINPTASSAVGTYELSLYKGASGAEEFIGSVRFAIVTLAGEITPIYIKTPKLPAETRVSACIASLAGGSETMGISIGYNS